MSCGRRWLQIQSTIHSRALAAGWRPARPVLAPFAPWAVPYANLRNHRKILVIDGAHGFTGGMNLRQRQSPSAEPPRVVDDHHFELSGPVVQHLQQTLVDDWQFTTNERLVGAIGFPNLLKRTGSSVAALLMALTKVSITRDSSYRGHSTLRRNVWSLSTPYFLPDRELISSLNLAALRGVVVDIVLPQVNNLHLWNGPPWPCAGKYSNEVAASGALHPPSITPNS